jgi:hypothetical protein
MKPPLSPAPTPPPDSSRTEEAPAVPGLRSWGRVYAAVVVGFLIGLVLLALLPRVVS